MYWFINSKFSCFLGESYGDEDESSVSSKKKTPKKNLASDLVWTTSPSGVSENGDDNGQAMVNERVTRSARRRKKKKETMSNIGKSTDGGNKFGGRNPRHHQNQIQKSWNNLADDDHSSSGGKSKSISEEEISSNSTAGFCSKLFFVIILFLMAFGVAFFAANWTDSSSIEKILDDNDDLQASYLNTQDRPFDHDQHTQNHHSDVQNENIGEVINEQVIEENVNWFPDFIAFEEDSAESG